MSKPVTTDDCAALRAQCAKSWRDKLMGLIAVLAILSSVYIAQLPNYGSAINQINRSVGKMEGQMELFLQHIRLNDPTLTARG